MKLKLIFLSLFIGAILTIFLLNCSSSYLVGFPFFIYSLFPMGKLLGIIELYLFTTIFIFLLFWVKKFRIKYIFLALIVISFFILNMIASKFTSLDVDFTFLFNKLSRVD